MTIIQLLQHDFLILHDIRVTVFGQYSIDEVSDIYQNLLKNTEIFVGLDIEYIIVYLLFYFPDSIEKIYSLYNDLNIDEKGVTKERFG